MYNFILRIESLEFFATKQYQKSITDLVGSRPTSKITGSPTPFFCLFVCFFVSLFNQEFTSCKADQPPRGMKKKRRTKRLKPYTNAVQKEPVDKWCLLILDFLNSSHLHHTSEESILQAENSRESLIRSGNHPIPAPIFSKGNNLPVS